MTRILPGATKNDVLHSYSSNGHLKLLFIGTLIHFHQGYK